MGSRPTSDVKSGACYLSPMHETSAQAGVATPALDIPWPNVFDYGVQATVCYIEREDKILLQLKAAHKFGGGRWNGPGGKLEGQEEPKEAIIREVREETGLVIKNPRFHGIMVLVFGVPEHYRLTAHIYTAHTFTGKPSGNEEGRLRWFPKNRLPYDLMWVDNRYWLPIVLAGGYIRGLCVFENDDGRTLLDCQLAVRWAS
jgi:8-oxo-dGTP diphosphatase